MRRAGIILMVAWLLALFVLLAWARHRAEAEVIDISDVTLGEFAALRTTRGWQCYQLSNHVGQLVWVARPDIQVHPHL